MNPDKNNRTIKSYILLLFLLNFTGAIGQEVNITNTIGNQIISVFNIPKKVNEKYDQLKTENKDHQVLIAEATNNREVLTSLEKIDSREIKSMFVEKDSTDGNLRSFIILVIRDASIQEKSMQPIFVMVEQPASPAGDLQTYLTTLQKAIKYPASAMAAGLTGKVILEFIVQKDGQLSDIKVRAGIGSGCDEEAIRVLSSSPPWKAALQNGKPVAQKMIIPIVFKPKNQGTADVKKDYPTMVKESISITNRQQQSNDGGIIIAGKATYNGLPVSDVNILLSGTTEGTTTNDQGEYYFRTKLPLGTLTFSHICYETITLSFGN